MERLDFRINENGIERWVPNETVQNRLLSICPTLAEEIMLKMIYEEQPFEYKRGKDNEIHVRIEYKGPRPGNTGAKAVGMTLVIMFMLGPLFAWEQPRNPDRFISLGLNIENQRTSGNFTSISNPNGASLVERGPAQDDYVGLGVDVRVPATDSITLSASYMNIEGDTSHSRSNAAYTEATTYNGYRFNVGARLYFNK